MLQWTRLPKGLSILTGAFDSVRLGAIGLVATIGLGCRAMRPIRAGGARKARGIDRNQGHVYVY